MSVGKATVEVYLGRFADRLTFWTFNGLIHYKFLSSVPDVLQIDRENHNLFAYLSPEQRTSVVYTYLEKFLNWFVLFLNNSK